MSTTSTWPFEYDATNDYDFDTTPSPPAGEGWHRVRHANGRTVWRRITNACRIPHAIDAAEEADTAPVISIKVPGGKIVTEDTEPGAAIAASAHSTAARRATGSR
jgi:hypothetical protein